MITYVINTSQNKTFDCDQLFRLAGYNKTQWINCTLDKVKDCVDFIKNKQGTIVFEQFRIAVIVDFYDYDRIRAPYGTLSYIKEDGVDFSVYLPYIEAYINDKLLFELEKREYYPAECDVFYVKSSKFDYVERIDNLESQVNQIISPVEDSFVIKKRVSYNSLTEVYVDFEGNEVDKEKYLKTEADLKELNEVLDETTDKESREEILNKIQKKSEFLSAYQRKKLLKKKTVEEDFYTSFSIYCTKTLSLVFNIEDYPYSIDGDNAEGASQRLFFRAFNDRIGKLRKIRRHFYQTEAGNSVAKAAFDNLALSLYLIRIYERETFVSDEGDLDIDGIDTVQLKNLLLNAWNKVVVARNVSKENQSLYYSLKSLSNEKNKTTEVKEISYEDEIKRAKASIIIKDDKVKNSIDEQYKLVKTFGEDNTTFAQENKDEFNKVLLAYLENRDKTKESDVDYKYDKLLRSGAITTTNMCPSKQEFEQAINEKHDEISACLGQSLKDEYSVVSFDEEKKKADQAYKDYILAKNVLSKNFTFDIIFLIVTLVAMIVPFILIKVYSHYNVATVISFIYSALVFAGIFLISSLLMRLPSIYKLNKAKRSIADCYRTCLAKKKIAFNKLKKRYDVDLVKVEEYRHEIRIITLLHNANMQKERNVNNHRMVLEMVENCLSGILNNLGIYPAVDESMNIEGEFNVLAPINSSENKIYKIFSLEAIEDLIIKKNK